MRYRVLVSGADIGMVDVAFGELYNSTVVQGNRARTLIVNNGAEKMSEHKLELMRIFDTLPIRQQTKLLSFAYDLEEKRQ